MRELFKIFEKDIQKENFSLSEIVMCGVIIPAALILVMGFVGWLETL